MGQVLYEQPREKLRARGVGYLSLVELIQLVIASGSARVSAAKLSKQVERLVAKNSLDYQSLVAIAGLGDAKTCQLLGAVELGRRVALQSSNSSPSKDALQAYIQEVAKAHGYQIITYWLDGSGREIDHKAYTIAKNEHYTLITKRIFADAFAALARSLYVFVVTKNSVKTPSTQEMGLISSVYETSQLLGVKVEGIYAIYGSVHKNWSHGI